MQQDTQAVAAAMQKSAQNQVAKPRDIRTAIQDMKPLLDQALPKHLTADRVIQMALNYIRQNPLIGKCTEASLMGAIMQASVTGLELIPILGQVYLVPYKANKGTRDNQQWVDEVQFQLGYRGLLKLIHNSNQIKTIYAEVVREGDIFEHEKGDNPYIKHIPKAKYNAKITQAYAIAHTISGGIYRKVLEREEIELLRRRNRMQKDQPTGAWQTDYAEMAQAKAIKKLAKLLPLSTDIQKAIETDEAIISEKAFTNNQAGIDIEAVEFQTDQWMADFEAPEKEGQHVQ